MPQKYTSSLPISLTAAQHAALEAIAGAGHKADYIRALIAADFECKGIQWPNDLQQRGKYKRVKGK